MTSMKRGEHLDGRLVFGDHLGIFRDLAPGAFSGLEETLGFEQGVSVALQATGVP